MLLIFLSEYFEVFFIYYLYCSCKINPLTHFIFLIFHFLFLSETEGHHNRLRKADCARTNKNVPWRILAERFLFHRTQFPMKREDSHLFRW